MNIYSKIEINSVDFLILEYYSGGNLLNMVKANGPIQPPKLYNYCYQILCAVQYLHQNNIVHLDNNPSNIMFDSNNRIKFIDFGLSQQIVSNRTSGLYESIESIPLESFIQKEGYDPFLADVFSVGLTFYIISQGHDPFAADKKKIISHLTNNKSDPFNQSLEIPSQAMIHQVIHKDPKQRPTISQLFNHPIFQK
jgi:MAP/microtubule affinity-regulating kinase